MKSILKITIICLLLISILAYSDQNNARDNQTINKDYFVFKMNNTSLRYNNFDFKSENQELKVRVISTTGNYSTPKIIINMSYIENITYVDDKMVIQIK